MILINPVGYFYQKADSGGVKQPLLNFQRVRISDKYYLIDLRGFNCPNYLFFGGGGQNELICSWPGGGVISQFAPQ